MSKPGEWGDKTIIIPHKYEDDPRRHKSRCEHYRKSDGWCCVNKGHCHGSRNCGDYSELTIPDDSIPPATPKKPEKENQPKPQTQEDLLRRVGTRLKHIIYGEVTVQSSTDKNITVITSSGKIHTLQITECIEQNIIKF